MSKHYLLALDQGTTSSRAVLYDLAGNEVKGGQVPLAVRFPRDGWVEQDPEEILQSQLTAMRAATEGIEAESIAAIGITNQRETVVAWDPETGKSLAPAIVWQCRRSVEQCRRLVESGLSELIKSKTGLVIDAYFSATKIAWLMENVDGLKERAKQGGVKFGTVDSWLLHHLTAGNGMPVCRTEPSNASRTMLYSLTDGDWDEELLQCFSLSRSMLPEIRESGTVFGHTSILGPKIPITAVLGDQQASLLGHGCIEPETVKCTYGTGAFMLLNTGESIRRSGSGLLSSVAWKFGDHTDFALEGSIFIAGALIQWLRDNLGLFQRAEDSEALAASTENSAGVIVVPAFVGLGAPYWDPTARGAIFGLTRETGPAHIVRASLEAVAHQSADLIEAEEFSGVRSIAIDGGMAKNRVFCALLADITGREIRVRESTELTAVGAARAAGIGAGIFADVEESVQNFAATGKIEAFLPSISETQRAEQRRRWGEAIARVRS